MINNSCFTEFGRSLERGEFKKLSPNSFEYEQLWQEQLNRCLNGYSVGGKKMTGKLYAYVNFGTIIDIDSRNNRKVVTPTLRDVEWLVFGAIQMAEEKKKNLMLMSGRRGGKSYILGFNAAYYYIFHEYGQSLLCAYESKYAYDVVKKARDHIEGFRTKGTQFYRSISKDQPASAIVSGRKENIDGAWTTVGDGAAIYNICFNNNPNAAWGKSANFVGIDEIGKFEKLLEAYEATDPCVKQGTNRFGMIMMAGTGGDMEKGTIDASKMFNDPETYDLLAFWDDQKPESSKQFYIPEPPYRINRTKDNPAGLFIPGYMLLEEKFRDENGNSKVDEAIAFIQETRETKKKGKDITAYTKYVQFYPLTIAEVFMASNQNIFPVGLLQEQIERIMMSEVLKNIGIRGELVITNGEIEFRPNPELREADFPINKSRSNKGCIVIYEEPYKVNKKVPDFLYIAGTDPYAQDQADSSPSLGSTFIYKRFYTYGEIHDTIVAEYTGRPDTAEEYYDNVRKLLLYYNAKCLYENNIPGMKQYFETKNALMLLAKQPKIVKDIIMDSRVERTYGINMSGKMKSFLLEAIKSWLLEEYAPNKYNLEKIYSVNLLKELINYNPDGNFDRVIAFGLCLIQDLEWHKRNPKDETKEVVDPFRALTKYYGFRQLGT
jgi:hypothetical protein